MSNEKCALTGYPLATAPVYDPMNQTMTYAHPAVGVIIMGRVYYQTQVNMQRRDWVTAGYARRQFMSTQNPTSLTEGSIEDFRANGVYPRTFEERGRFVLEELYAKGGKEGKTFGLDSQKECTQFYCEGAQDFKRVLQRLGDLGQIHFQEIPQVGGWVEVRLLPKGLAEVEKGLPQMPLVGLVSQEITTGDPEMDKQINHARKLFHDSPQDMEHMRSAVIELARILEPLRDELKKHFGHPDIEVFFQLVNVFDVRHNNERTKEVKLPEQLEWLYYSLLNTINAYIKIKRRLGQ